MKLKLTMMSMEELSRLSRNIGEDKLCREAAIRELAKRENTIFQSKVIGALKPTDYPAYDLL